MAATLSRFSKVAWPRVLPDHGSCTFCGGPFSAVTLKSGLRLERSAIQYRRGTSRTGELDGAQEANGG